MSNICKEDVDKISIALDKLDSRLDDVDKTLIRQEMNLQQHMERSEKAETMIEMLSKEMKHISESEIKPIQKHVNMMHGALKLIGIVATLLAVLKGFGVM